MLQTQLTSDESRAALGIGTGLMQHLIPQAPQETQAPSTAPIGTQSASQAQTVTPGQQNASAPKEAKPDKTAEIKLMLTQELEEIRKELKADHQREMDGIKQQITAALADESES